jgi:hypothetical protein
MVRRGSTVRVRQRAKIPAKQFILLSVLIRQSTSVSRRGSRLVPWAATRANRAFKRVRADTAD